mmetsp:Transcript_11963/g.34599  ORF Transcript_11963/g.34599 Transcript_11963/m.34599 type:complete len:227 (+) Transcript_11963:557-1237(+)
MGQAGSECTTTGTFASHIPILSLAPIARLAHLHAMHRHPVADGTVLRSAFQHRNRMAVCTGVLHRLVGRVLGPSMGYFERIWRLSGPRQRQAHGQHRAHPVGGPVRVDRCHPNFHHTGSGDRRVRPPRMDGAARETRHRQGRDARQGQDCADHGVVDGAALRSAGWRRAVGQAADTRTRADVSLCLGDCDERERLLHRSSTVVVRRRIVTINIRILLPISMPMHHP